MADYVFLTSGSTGEPKRIVRKREQLVADASAIARAFRHSFEKASAFVSSVRAEHFYGALWRNEVPAALGIECDAAVAVSVEELSSLVRQYGKIVFVTTPSFLEKALDHPDFAALRGGFADIVTSGSALREKTALRIKESLGVCPLEIYGSTEAGTVAWRRWEDGAAANLAEGVEVTVDGDGSLVITASPNAMSIPLAMSDKVRLVDGCKIEVLGRSDRQVKVLEEMVSLVSVERAFEAHPLIDAARAELFGDSVPRIGIVCTLSQAGRERLIGGTFSQLIAELRRDLSPSVRSVAFPRRIRFFREMPVDARGKTPVALVRKALAAHLREPVTLCWSATQNSLAAELAFPPDMEVFDGHFPNCPILPGVAQLHYLTYFARQVFPDFPMCGTYRKLKFRRLIRPGEVVAMQVERSGEREFSFSLSVKGEIAASGSLSGEGEVEC